MSSPKTCAGHHGTEHVLPEEAKPAGWMLGAAGDQPATRRDSLLEMMPEERQGDRLLGILHPDTLGSSSSLELFQVLLGAPFAWTSFMQYLRASVRAQLINTPAIKRKPSSGVKAEIKPQSLTGPTLKSVQTRLVDHPSSSIAKTFSQYKG